MILPITGFVRSLGFFRITVNRLTRLTNEVTFDWPRFCSNSIKSPSRQVPPQLLIHAFFEIDLTVDCFLADPQFVAFIEHPIADLFGCPALFDPVNPAFAPIRMSNQFALHGSPLLRALVCCHAKVSGVLLGQRVIRPKVAFDLAKDRRLVML